MSRPPLAFPASDPTFTELFDDGESGGHGDLLAGDHVYTIDTDRHTQRQLRYG